MTLDKSAKKIITDPLTKKDVVLYSVLDWGMGHATRSIPIIDEISKQCKEIIIVASGLSAQVLESVFPHLTIEKIDHKEIRYESSMMWINLVKQLPQLKKLIDINKATAAALTKKYNATIIISDNHFGFRNKQTKNIYITHQMMIHHNNELVSFFATQWHQKVMSKFDEIWVPDYASDNQSLAGKLSRSAHPNVKYLGPITTIQKLDLEKTIDISIILSGPEPQRTLMENKWIQTLHKENKKITLIRGTQKPTEKPTPHLWNVIDIADRNTIEYTLNSCRTLIARSGYTTIMDIEKLNIAKVIFVPTPGQSEQEYLAEYISHKYDHIQVIRQDQIIKNPDI
jgi:uncharacterized protein (TIGR00661 family)